MSKKLVFLLTIFLLVFCGEKVNSEPKDCFRAAVYQHFPLGNYETEEVSVIIKKNLDVFEEMASKASKEGVNVIVFPEDGIIDPESPKIKNAEIAEEIPDPQKGHYNPCKNAEEYKTRVKTYRLSCLAQTNQLYIVADYGDRVHCNNTSDPKCPNEGFYLFNTAVVFGPDGSLVAKYHKMQLFFEFYYDVPPKPEFVYFDTPFGRMGLFICFDILFRNPGIELISKYKVDTILYPTWWFDELPFRTAQQIQEEWALTNRVNLLAANMHRLDLGSVGGGIYSGINGQIITSDIIEKSPQLLIADIPIKSSNNGAQCLRQPFNKTILNTKFVDQKKYKSAVTMVLEHSNTQRLTDNSSSINLCHNDLCCQLDYTLNSENILLNEKKFWFIVANRSGPEMLRTAYPISEEICGVFRCDDNSCHQFSTQTNIIFKSLEIKAHMSTRYVYPSATTNGLKLIPKNNLFYQNNEKIGSEVKFSLKNYSEPLLSFVLYGRPYDRDPPYKQK